MRRSRDLVDARTARAGRSLARSDPATAMLCALASHLHGRPVELGRALPRGASWALGPFARALSALPARIQEELYALAARGEAISVDELAALDAEDVAAWMISRYPQRAWPAVALGASNGALLHLCAALGVPWLPQTFSVPVEMAGLDVDDAREALERARAPARQVLLKNPELLLHHQRDPGRDRLRLRRATCFRFKRRVLGAAFTRFIEDRVAPGGTIFVFDCRRSWPTTRVDERHVLQFGAPGGADEREYFEGSARVERYLSARRASRTKWDPPPPDGRSPEAEWGFDPELMHDVERLARRRGLEIVRVVFSEPEEPSPLVADLYRAWYRENGLPGAQLLVESFTLVDPWSAIRTASVPFWLLGNEERSLVVVERYLDDGPPYDYLLLALFAHGVPSVGLAPASEWRAVLERARVRGRFVGVDPWAFPRDLGGAARFVRALRRIHPRLPMPPPMDRAFLDAFLEEHGGSYAVRFLRAGVRSSFQTSPPT